MLIFLILTAVVLFMIVMGTSALSKSSPQAESTQSVICGIIKKGGKNADRF